MLKSKELCLINISPSPVPTYSRCPVVGVPPRHVRLCLPGAVELLVAVVAGDRLLVGRVHVLVPLRSQRKLILAPFLQSSNEREDVKRKCTMMYIQSLARF